MTVSQRLYLAVIPGIVGVFTVAGLAYWGQYGRQAPRVLVLVAIVATVVSLVAAWRNTRYVASRVARLAAPAQRRQVDELDAIEGEVDRLRSAVATAQADEVSTAEHAEAAIREYGNLVADTATTAARQLDEIRMPLYILLESRFGDLNENQEEMVAAARVAADDAQGYLERLREIADLDRRALRVRSERVHLADILTALMPGLRAEAARADIHVSSELPPFLPPLSADRVRLGEAVSLLATDAVRRTPPGGDVTITATAEQAAGPGASTSAGPGARTPRDVAVGVGGAVGASASRSTRSVQLTLSHGSGVARQTDVALANRLIVALGGRIDYAADRTTVTLPAYSEALPPSVDTGRAQTSR